MAEHDRITEAAEAIADLRAELADAQRQADEAAASNNPELMKASIETLLTLTNALADMAIDVSSTVIANTETS